MSAQDLSTLTNKKTKTPEVTVVPSVMKELFVWEAPVRPFKKRDKEYFSTIGTIVFLLAVILFFIKEWLLIAVVVAVMFVSYVLATVPPGEITHKITNKGVKTGDKIYLWDWLSRFWFSKKWECEILHIETRLLFPRQLQLVIKGKDREKVKLLVEKYLLFEKPKKTLIDKAADWLQEKVPLES